MPEATLAIRAWDAKEYFEAVEPPPTLRAEAVYGVALVAAPLLPDSKHPRCAPFSVVCIANYRTLDHPETAWGWIHLTPETKEEIGDDLVEWGATPGKWYWLVMRMSGAGAQTQRRLTGGGSPRQVQSGGAAGSGDRPATQFYHRGNYERVCSIPSQNKTL